MSESESESPLLPESDGQGPRFVPGEAGFERRTSLVDGLLAHWTIVAGTGSWLEAHLLARLGGALAWPNLGGCGISEEEVWQLVEAQGDARPLLLILCESIAADRGRGLMLRLRRERPNVQILLLLQRQRGSLAAGLRDWRHLAIVHVESFGSGTAIRALQALRSGTPFLDPRLGQALDQQALCRLTGREQQTLEGLARGGSNRSIAMALGIAPATVRDYVSSLCKKLAAANRTEVVSRGIALGLIEP